jgi:hypothetical protein
MGNEVAFGPDSEDSEDNEKRSSRGARYDCNCRYRRRHSTHSAEFGTY